MSSLLDLESRDVRVRRRRSPSSSARSPRRRSRRPRWKLRRRRAAPRGVWRRDYASAPDATGERLNRGRPRGARRRARGTVPGGGATPSDARRGRQGPGRAPARRAQRRHAAPLVPAREQPMPLAELLARVSPQFGGAARRRAVRGARGSRPPRLRAGAGRPPWPAGAPARGRSAPAQCAAGYRRGGRPPAARATGAWSDLWETRDRGLPRATWGIGETSTQLRSRPREHSLTEAGAVPAQAPGGPRTASSTTLQLGRPPLAYSAAPYRG